MSRNKIIALVVVVLSVVLVLAFVTQVRKLRQQLRSSVRIVPTEPKSRENQLQSGMEDNVFSVRPRLLVKFRAGTSTKRINEIIDQFNHNVQDEIEAVPGLNVIGSPENRDATEVAADYRDLPEVEYAEPNFQVTLDSSANTVKQIGVNDPRFEEQKWLTDIRAVEAWATTKGSDQIVVAVLDSGVEYTHTDLVNNIWTRPPAIAPYQDRDLGTVDDLHGYHALMKDGDPMDDNGHGTNCAGIIGAECGNKLGVCGVNWKTKILPLKFINAGGYGTVADAVEAINYAINRKRAGVNIRIISASWSLTQNSRAFEDAIRASYEAGILFVTAAGNSSSNIEGITHYPAYHKLGNVISVTVLGQEVSKGPSARVSAPGENILTTALGNEYVSRSGSSMSTAIVSGVAALTLAAHPELSVDQLRARLLESYDGRINAARAVK